MKTLFSKIIGKRIITALLAGMMIFGALPFGVASAADPLQSGAPAAAPEEVNVSEEREPAAPAAAAPGAPSPAAAPAAAAEVNASEEIESVAPAAAPAAAAAGAPGCPAGWQQSAPGSSSCFSIFPNEAAAKAASCPKGYKNPTVTDKTLTCSKNAAAAAAAPADILEKVQLLMTAQEVINRLLWPVLVMIGGLLDNSLLFGNGMEERLRDIWIPIRNLVNILFVVVLVGIALYNVLGLGEESSTYSIKSILPKIIVGIIAINFSFLGIKVFLDAVNVLTVSVFSLPTQVGQGLDQIIDVDSKDNKNLCIQLQSITPEQLKEFGDENIEKARVDSIYVSVAKEKQIGDFKNKGEVLAAFANPANAAKEKDFDNEVQRRINGALCTGSQLNDQGKQFLRRFGARNAAFALALNMGKITFYQDVDFNSLKNTETLLVNTVFSMMLYLVYAVSFIALFIVLLARLVVMWLCIAISPVLLLVLAAPDLKSKLGGFGEIADQFVKNAIAPLLIALSLSIGWIMLNALQGLNQFDSQSALVIDPTQGVPIVGLNTIQDFTVALATIAVVWMGVFTAAEGTVAKTATSWLGDKVKQAGTWLGTLPLKHTPIFPVKVPGAEGTYSGAEIYTALNEGLSRMTDSRALADKIFGATTQARDLGNVKSGDELIETLAKRLKATGNTGLGTADKQMLTKLKGNPATWRQLQTDVEGKHNGFDLWKKIVAFEAANKVNLKVASGDIRSHALVSAELRKPSQATAVKGASGAAPAGAAPAGAAPTAQNNIGDGTFADAVQKTATDTDEQHQKKIDARLKRFADTIKKFDEDVSKGVRLQGGETEKDAIVRELGKLKFEGVALTGEQLRARVSNTAYNEITRHINKDELTAVLAAPPPAPPAPPAAP